MGSLERNIQDWVRLYKATHTPVENEKNVYFVGEEKNGYKLHITETDKRVGIWVDNDFNRPEQQEPVISSFSIWVDLVDGDFVGLSRTTVKPIDPPHFNVRVYDTYSRRDIELVYEPLLNDPSTTVLTKVNSLDSSSPFTYESQQFYALNSKMPRFIDPMASLFNIMQNADMSPAQMRKNPFVEVKAILPPVKRANKK